MVTARQCCGALGVLALAAAMEVQTMAANGQDRTRGRVIYNLDCSEFFVGTFGPNTPATIDQFVAEHAAAGVTDLFVNVNAQRTNYRSAVWEADWDGLDPAAADPAKAGWFLNSRRLWEQGCDYPERMLASARRHRIGAWISLRMNDAHLPNQPEHRFHSTFWREHPDWRLANSALDYEQAAVREHYLNLVREVCERYDIDGLELDYLRFWLYFRPGREHQGVRIMTEFVQNVRRCATAAAARLGHPVALAVRVPSTPWIARRHGLDAVGWARAGLVDLVIAAPWWESANSDIPVETWKGLLQGTGVEVALSLEDGIGSGGSGRRTMTPEEMRGILLSGWQRGADAVYFFNLFTGPFQYWPRPVHDRLLRDAGSAAALRLGPRRHPLTLTAPWAAGEPGSARPLPSGGRQATFRLHIGPAPGAGQRPRIELKATDRDTPLAVFVNDIACEWFGLVEPEHVRAAGCKPPEAGMRHAYSIPAEALRDGYNLVEFRADEDVTVTWLEIAVDPVPGETP